MDEALAHGGQSTAERLLEDSWETRQRARASHRELIVETAAAALFAAAAAGLLLLVGTPTGTRLGTVGLLILAYAAVARIEFPIGAGHVVPTQLVLMPMLVLLSPAIVPVAVATALALTSAVDSVLGHAPPRRILSSVPDAWHALGPATVLALAGSPAVTLQRLPLMAVAFAACCFVDLVSSLARTRLSGVVPNLAVQSRVIVSVWVVDACLAPVGFLAGVELDRSRAALLFVLPLGFLLWLLARDRRRRIQQAYDRLKLVERERARLQSAVRRLGDAFAAKLELEALLEILLHGSLEALDADAAHLRLTQTEPPYELQSGSTLGMRVLEFTPREPIAPEQPIQHSHGGAWRLAVPIRIAATPDAVVGSVEFARLERSFEEDEIALISELIGKAQIAAGEILSHRVLREQAETDPLTGLGNRRKLIADLSLALDKAGTSTPSLLLLFDLDGFKAYNDTFGHLAGDALLSRLAANLADAVADRGAAYRLGGDEFCAWMKLDNADPDELIARTAAALAETGTHFSIQASSGVVLLPHEADSPDHALHLADERMYADKRGRPGGARNQARDVLMQTMQIKQHDLDEHSTVVAELAVRVARRLGVHGEAIDEIARAAELHDVGKVGIPDTILNKPGPLSVKEWKFMQQHTILGERILNAAPALRPIARLVRSSHERWDGSGYPDGLAGEEIPLGARIVAACDAYEAMIARRPYRNAIPPQAALRELQAAAGSQFDPMVVAAFVAVIHDLEAAPERDGIKHAADHVRTLLRCPPLTVLEGGVHESHGKERASA